MTKKISELDRQITAAVLKLRHLHNDKQVDLAAILGVSRSFIAKVEASLGAYNIQHINAIAFAYNCSLHDIIPKKPIAISES